VSAVLTAIPWRTVQRAATSARSSAVASRRPDQLVWLQARRAPADVEREDTVMAPVAVEGSGVICPACSTDINTLAKGIVTTTGDTAAILAVRADRERRAAAQELARLVATRDVRIVTDARTGDLTFELVPERMSLARALVRVVARWMWPGHEVA
jgi:hypothetical protein